MVQHEACKVSSKVNSVNVIQIWFYLPVNIMTLWFDSPYSQPTHPSYLMVITILFLIRRFNAIVSQLKMHYFSGGAFESLISSQLLKKEKYI